jgi:hypothetical protein
LADDVLAGYSDRSACLVVTACGAGTVAILNADLSASNLPGSPAFVPLLGELMGRLVARTGGGDAAPCGEALALSLPATAGPAAGLTLNGPSGAAPGQIREDAGAVQWTSPGPEAPGIYQVRRGEAVVFAAASALPPEESDLRPLPASLIPTQPGGGRAVYYRTAGEGDEPDTLWVWLAAGCVACLLGEVLALKSFRI